LLGIIEASILVGKGRTSEDLRRIGKIEAMFLDIDFRFVSLHVNRMA